jgi:dipeptidyl aminopeptidase/acylaminoacyl peptidase
MDLDRVGLYGGSAGGQSTLAALIWHHDFYKAGAADCGCHDNRMDKIWWNEQWMDYPIDESYPANSNTEHVTAMQGELFLTVGEVDTNVDPSSTMQVVNALIKADKDFQFYSVPNGKHGIGEIPYLRNRRVQFFKRTLGGPE